MRFNKHFFFFGKIFLSVSFRSLITFSLQSGSHFQWCFILILSFSNFVWLSFKDTHTATSHHTLDLRFRFSIQTTNPTLIAHCSSLFSICSQIHDKMAYSYSFHWNWLWIFFSPSNLNVISMSLLLEEEKTKIVNGKFKFDRTKYKYITFGFYRIWISSKVLQ